MNAESKPDRDTIARTAERHLHNGGRLIRENSQGFECYAVEGGLFYVRDFLADISGALKAEALREFAASLPDAYDTAAAIALVRAALIEGESS